MYLGGICFLKWQLITYLE